MLEVLKIVVLCLICVVITAFFSTVLVTALLFTVLTVLFYDFDFETPLERHAINKVKHAYLKVRILKQTICRDNITSSQYIYTPSMSNVNQQPVDFDLSRFTRSGSVFSPIARVGASGTSVSRRLLPTQTSTPLTRNSPWQKNSISATKAMTFHSSTMSRSPR